MEKDLTLVLERWGECQAEKIAACAGGESITYGELRDRSLHLAALLDRLGMQPGDPILICMPNCIEYLITFFAAVRLKLDIAPAHAMSRGPELLQMVQTIRPRLAVVWDGEKELLLRTVCQELQVLRLGREEMRACEQIDGGPALPLGKKTEETGRIYVSTSGSTGKLKFVTNTYLNEFTNAELYLQRLQISREDTVLVELPITQKFGMAAMLGSCIAGSTLLLSSRFDAAASLRLIEKHRVTVQYGVPTMYVREIEAYEKAEYKPDISSLRTGIIAGAFGAPEVFGWFEEMAGCRLLNCYGTTEIGGLTMTSYEDSEDIRYSSCGRIFSGAEIRIVDEKGCPLPQGMDGEVVCVVPWVMQGYAGEPELTAGMFDRQGRFLTGDIGRLDENGNLTISGRKKDLIIRSGYNVFPAEVECALLKLPGVREAGVLGQQDKYLGERICAFVSAEENGPASAEEIRNGLSELLAKYKLPDRVIFLKEIPKLPNGKFDYPALTAMLKEPV